MGEFPNKKTQFQKGHKGIGGRPKGSLSNKTILNKFLSLELEQKNPFTGEVEKMTVKELMNLKLLAKGLEGDLASYKEIADREEGKVTNNVDITSKGEKLNYTDEEREKEIKKLIEKKNADKSGDLPTG